MDFEYKKYDLIPFMGCPMQLEKIDKKIIFELGKDLKNKKIAIVEDKKLNFYSLKFNTKYIKHYCIFLFYIIIFAYFNLGIFNMLKNIPLIILLHVLFLFNIMRRSISGVFKKWKLFHGFFIIAGIIFSLYNSPYSTSTTKTIINLMIPLIIFMLYIYFLYSSNKLKNEKR